VEISIVKVESSGPHRAVVARPGAEAAQFAVYDYGPLLPHDLVHYVVEAEVGLEFGFWGLLAAGAKLQAVQAYGARDPKRIPREEDPLVGAHVDDLLNAERLVAAFSGLPGTDPDHELDTATAERIQARIDELNGRWQATAAGDVFRLNWPDPGPAGGAHTLRSRCEPPIGRLSRLAAKRAGTRSTGSP
jgi:hypothetical protein